jgi:hypothetical protein
MSVCSFRVNIQPMEALKMVIENQDADLIHEEIHELGESRHLCVLVFEKYFFRTSNRAALTVIIENKDGVTGVRSIAAGTSQGMIFSFDWGAAEDFAYSVRDILEDYVI